AALRARLRRDLSRSRSAARTLSYHRTDGRRAHRLRSRRVACGPHRRTIRRDHHRPHTQCRWRAQDGADDARRRSPRRVCAVDATAGTDQKLLAALTRAGTRTRYATLCAPTIFSATTEAHSLNLFCEGI